MKNRNPNFSSLFANAVVASLFLATLATPSRAANGADTWTGATATFNTSTNWTGTNKPPISGDSLVFGAAGAGGTTLSDNLMTPSTYNLVGITFNSGAAVFIINPATAGTNGFKLTGNITNNSTSLETINDLITLGATDTVTTGGGVTLGGVVSGSGFGLTTAGTGTLTLGGIDTFTGTLTIGTGSTVAIASTGKLNSGSYAGAIANSGTFNFGGSSSQTLSGTISGTGALIDSGTGALTLTANDTYTGATTINSGSSLTFSELDGGSYAGTITDNGTLTYAGTITQTLSGTFTGVANTGTLVDNGTGTLIYTGGAAFTGNITVDKGTFQVGNSTSSTINTSSSTDKLIIASGATLDFNSTHGQALDQTISGAGNLIINDEGTAFINIATNDAGFTGSTQINASGFEFTNGGSLANSELTFTGNGILEDSSTSSNGVAGVMINSGVTATVEGLSSTGGSTMALNGITRSTGGLLNFGNFSNIDTTTTANTNGIFGTWAFTGTGSALSYVTDTGSTGPFSIGVYSGATPDADGSLSIATNPTANYSTSFATVANSTAITGNTLQFRSTGLGDPDVTWTNTGGATLNGLMNSSGGTLTESGAAITIGTQQELDILTSGGNITLGSAIADNAAGASSLVFESVGTTNNLGTANVAGTDTLTLTANNTYTGNTYIEGGTLAFSGAGQLDSGSYAGAIVTSGNGTFAYDSSASQTLSGVVSGTGTLSLGGTGMLSLNNANDSLYNLIFTANSTLGGTGVLTLDNTTSGNTGGAIQVNSGATGTIAAGLTVALVPTNAVGTNGFINGGGTLDIYGTLTDTNTLNFNNITANIYGTVTVPYLETQQIESTTAPSNSFINILGGKVTTSDAIIIQNQALVAGNAGGYSALTIGTGSVVSTGAGSKGYTTILPGTDVGNAYLNLNGGLLTTSFFNQTVATAIGQSALYFNGGTLAMNENFTTSGSGTSLVSYFLSNIGSSTTSANFVGGDGLIGAGGVYIGGTNGSGGAVISLNGWTNAISQAFLSGDGVAGSSAVGNTAGQTDGGVTYTGGGVLTLAVASAGSTYTGGTTIDGTKASGTYVNPVVGGFVNTTVISSVAGDLGASTSSLLIDNGGILNLDGVSQQVGAITFGALGTTTGSLLTSNVGVTATAATLTGTTANVYGTGNVIDTTVTVAANTTVDNGGSLAVNGQVNGTMEVDGGGSLALNGQVNGTTAVDDGATLTGTGTVNGNSTLNGAGVINFGTGGNIIGTLGVTGGNWNGVGSVGGLVTSSSGAFNIGKSATLTATSGVSVTGGTISSADQTGTIAGSLGYASSATSTFAGVIADSTTGSTLSVSAGTLNLSGTSTFTGGTTVSGGTLELSGTNDLLTTGSVTLSGAGVIDLEGTAQKFGALNGTSGTIESLETLGNNSSTLTIGNGNVSGSYGGTIMDGVNGDSFTSLVKTGSGTQVLSGASQYSGGTTINGGVLQVASENSLGNSGGYFASFGSGFVPTIALAGGELQTTTTTGIVEKVTLASGTTNTLAASSGTAATYSGVISDATSTGGLTVGDTNGSTGTVILTAANTYTGPTTVVAHAGLGVTGSLNTSTSLAVNSGASFALGKAAGGTSFLSQTVATLSLTSTVGAGNEAELKFDLASVGNDSLTSTGAFTLTGSSFNLILTGTAGTGTYDLVEWATTGSSNITTGDVDLTLNGVSLGLNSSDLSVVTSGNNDILEFNASAAAAPEPGAAAMMLLGLGLLVSFQVYRKKQTQV